MILQLMMKFSDIFLLQSMFSFDNFPDTNNTNFKLTPRSNESLKRTGFKLQDLIVRTADDINSKYNDNVSDKILVEKRVAHYEQKRRGKLDILRKMRGEVLEQQGRGAWNAQSKSRTIAGESRVEGSSGGAMKSSLIEKQMKQLEKIKFKQQKEIQQTIQYQMKMEEIRKNNEEKMNAQHEKEEKKKKELDQKRRQEEAIKKQKQEEAKKKMEEQAFIQQKKFQEMKQKQQKVKQNQKRKQKQREDRNKLIQQEKKIKQEQFMKQKDKNLQEQQLQMIKRKQQMQKKQIERVMMMEQVNQKKKQENNLKRHEKEEKLKQARQRNQEALIQLNNKFKSRQDQIQKRRVQFQAQKKKHAEDMKIRAEIHNQKMKEVIGSSAQQQQKKKQEYYKKQKEAEQRKREIQQQLRLEAISKKLAEQKKQEERRLVRQNNQKQMQKYKLDLKKKLESKEQNLIRVQKEREIKMLEKHNEDIIKRTDKKQNVERIMKVQEYQKQKLMFKIEQKMGKAELIKVEREDLLEQRQLMKKQIQKQKRDMMQKIQKLKQGKIDPNQLLNSLTKQSPQTIKIGSPDKTKTHVSNEQSRTIVQKIAVNKQPRKVQKTEPAKKTEEQAKRQLNQIIEKQNADMLKLLQDEQELQNQRQSRFAKATPEQKRKLQKQFGLQRAKAQMRIQKLSDAHATDIKKYKQINNLRN